MPILYIFIFLLKPISDKVLVDFNTASNMENWRVVNDGVMGGLSQSTFVLDSEGHAQFSGKVSLENNGGFASVRYNFDKTAVKANTQIKIKLKGDGKDYQFRVKDKSNKYYSYITTFSTSGEWETVTIDLKDMYPSFRGRKLNQDNFNHKSIEELTFLIANKRNENFKILIDKIEVI